MKNGKKKLLVMSLTAMMIMLFGLVASVKAGMDCGLQAPANNAVINKGTLFNASYSSAGTTEASINIVYYLVYFN